MTKLQGEADSAYAWVHLAAALAICNPGARATPVLAAHTAAPSLTRGSP